MKKVIILTLIMALTVVLGGCNKKQAKEEPAKPAAEKSTPAKKGLTVVDRTLKDWLTSGKGVECAVKDAEGEIITQTLGGKVLISGIPYADMKSGEVNEKGYSLTVGDWMYMWAGATGTKMNFKKLNEMTGVTVEDQEDQPETWDEMVDEWEEEKIDYQCEEKRLSDDLFIPPSNVEFMDLTVMMEGVAELGKELEANMGEDGEVDMEALKKITDELEKQME